VNHNGSDFEVLNVMVIN